MLSISAAATPVVPLQESKLRVADAPEDIAFSVGNAIAVMWYECVDIASLKNRLITDSAFKIKS
ncbi:hypothetical protein [Nostoc sp.]|uniref:hypothetical protein n=1 Tax=Nostoc sp. TaxID=1180 RepID=UPI002FFC2763